MLNSNAIIVLGMHRSGTSALTRVLNLLGMDLGQPLLPKHVTNETGFWEHKTIVTFNEKILHQLHSQWDDPRIISEQALSSVTLANIQRLLAKTLYQNFATSRLWGIKDPRLCRLLPFWLPLLENTGNNLYFIHILREPLEVAASLHRRDKLTLAQSLQLWLIHVLESERHTCYYPRVFVTYDELLNNWQATVEKIAQTLKITFSQSINSINHEVNHFLAPQLKHHCISKTQPTSFDKLSSLSYDVYRICQEAAYGNIKALYSLNVVKDELRYDNIFSSKLTHKITIHLILYLEKSQSSQWCSTMHSLQLQDYSCWRLSILSDFDPRTIMQNTITFHWRYIVEEHLIAQIIAQEIETVTADWVALILPGDRFESNLFSSCIDYITYYSHWKFIYLDEKNDSNQQIFKPDITIDLLRSTPYIGHFCLIQREAITAVGGYPNYQGRPNDDLIFKIIELYGESCIGHIPYPLYYSNNTQYDLLTYQQVVKQHLQRQHIDAQIYNTTFQNIYRIDYALRNPSFVSIIIVTTQEQETLEHCLNSILKITSYLHYEVIVVDNASLVPLQLDFCKQLLTETNKVRLIRHTQPTELSVLNNFAVQHAKGEFVLFLNDDSEIIQAEWLQHLLSNNQRTGVGIVGPKILDTQRNILQAGYILGMGAVGIAGQIHQGLAAYELGHDGRAQTAQNFLAIADNGMMIKRDIYQAVGGMDEKKTAILFNEVDLCLKVITMGYKIVWLPQVILLQHGIGSVIRHRQLVIDSDYLRQEVTTMYQRWLPRLSADPYYHPHLCLNGKEWCLETNFVTHWNIGKTVPFLHEMPRVIAFPNDNWGSGEYRVKIPLQNLKERQIIEYSLMPVDEFKKIPTLPELQRMQGDVLFLHNFLHTPALELLHNCQYTEYFKIFSQDDLVYAIPQLNSYYHTSYKDIKSRVHYAISLCDRLIVSTEPLAIAYRHLINDIQIVPNYLEFKQWQALTVIPKQGSKPRVGWAGAAQHLGDLRLILPVVKALAKEVDWIFFGMCPNELRPYVREFYPMVAFAQYPTQLAQLALDLAIAPLENNAFNEAKSNLRLLEYGILGYPVVCSDIYPYQSAPVTRVNNTSQAWIAAIREKINALEATQQEGKQLQQWVLRHWLLENNIEKWKYALNPAISKKYSFEPLVEKVRWVFILGNYLEAIQQLEELLCQHPAITKIEFSCQAIQLPKEIKITELWTEKEKLVKLSENEKNLEISDEKQKFGQQLSLKQGISTCIISNIPASMARTVWLQQHFPDAYFIHITADNQLATLALYHQCKILKQPFLHQRVINHISRSIELLMIDVVKLRHFLTVDYKELNENQEDILVRVLNFFNLT